MTFSKDPAAVLDYKLDWSDWMEDGDTITDDTVTVPAGLTLDSSSHDDASVTFWLSGGTAGQHYRVTVQITTSAGRVDERSVSVKVQER